MLFSNSFLTVNYLINSFFSYFVYAEARAIGLVQRYNTLFKRVFEPRNIWCIYCNCRCQTRDRAFSVTGTVGTSSVPKSLPFCCSWEQQDTEGGEIYSLNWCWRFLCHFKLGYCARDAENQAKWQERCKQNKQTFTALVFMVSCKQGQYMKPNLSCFSSKWR